MHRHRFDLTSFASGVKFASIGIVLALTAADVLDADLRWLVPSALVAIGVTIAVATTVARARPPVTGPPDGDRRA